jgi:hypothetical protein
MRISSGVVGALVVFGAGGKRFAGGAGAAGAGAGVAAGVALGTVPASQPPQLLQCGQTHSTVQPRTQTCFGTGQTINLWISRTRQWQSQESWQPLLQGSQALHDLHPPDSQQLSQPLPLSQRRLTPGMQSSLQQQLNLMTVEVFVVHVGWHTGTSLQPQCGQHWQASQPPLQPQAWQAGSHPAAQHSPAPACAAKATPQSKASPIVGNTYFVMIIVS